MNPDQRLESMLTHTMHANTGAGAIYTLLVQGRECNIALNPNQMYETLGIGQLAIVYFALEMIKEGRHDPEMMLTLHDEHRRTGTGVLQFCDAGTQLNVDAAIQLILIEGDITATNMLLAHLGSQSAINAWLKNQGLKTTGLSDRDDRLFESGAQRPQDMMRLVEELQMHPSAYDGLCRSHYRQGLRGFNHKERIPRNRRYEIAFASASSKYRHCVNRRIQDRLLAQTPHMRRSHVAVLKEGIHPNFGNQSYLHEAGWFLGSRNFRVVLCTIDVDQITINEIGRILYEWSQGA